MITSLTCHKLTILSVAELKENDRMNKHEYLWLYSINYAVYSTLILKNGRSELSKLYFLAD